MRSSWSTEVLLEFEDSSSDLLNQQLPQSGVMLWPLLRWPLSRQFARFEFGGEAVPRSIGRSTLVKRAARGFARRLSGRTGLSKPADHLFLVSGSTQGIEQGKTKNWLVDDYVLALGDRAAVIQERALTDRDRIVRRTISTADFLAGLQVSGGSRHLSRASSLLIGDFVREVLKVFPESDSAASADSLIRKLEYRARWAPRYRDTYQRILDKLDPSVVYIQGACYGDRSPLIEALHDRNIVVAEHQHGWIGPYHPAYNFGSAYRSGRLNRGLPDAFITFGAHWTEGLRFPNRLMIAGKPHLTNRAHAAPPWESRPRRVMVVSSVAHPDLVERQTLQLCEALPDDWTVSFRPHPSERSVVQTRYPMLASSSRVQFDLTPDVYDSLGSVRAVVGTSSTVLFEALAFSCTVVPLKDALNPLYIGELFGAPVESISEVARDVQLPPDARISSFSNVSESIWSPSSPESLRSVMHELESMRATRS